MPTRPLWRHAIRSCGMALLLAAVAGHADTLVLKDGSKVEGTIVEETADTVVLKVKFGSVPYKKSEIKEILRSGGAAVSPDAAELRDVVVLKSGAEHRGLLVEDGDKDITFDLIMSGKNVSKVMASRTAFQRSEIVELRKLTDSQRTAARSHLENIETRARQDAAAELNVKIETISWQAKDPAKAVPARKIELENFSIESNTDEEFLRRAAFRLGKVFGAYKQHFGVDRNQTTKVRVLIFNSMAQYYAALGNQIKNPAFYQPDAKLICAGCDVALYERAIGMIRREHGSLDGQLQEWKRQLTEARAKVQAEVSKAYDQAKGAGAGGAAALEQIKAQQRQWQVQVGQMEKVVTQIQDQLVALNRRNDLVFNEYTKRMFSTLYHEGFHAFLDNFLFPQGQNQEVPRWLNEGLAQYFECARLEGDRFVLGQEDRPKMAFLRQCRKDGKLIPLEQVITGGQSDYMVQDMADVERSAKHYLQAWCLTHLLGEKGRLKKDVLQAYVAQLAARKPPMEALLGLAGMTSEQLQAAWEEKLKPSFEAGQPASKAGDEK